MSNDTLMAEVDKRTNLAFSNEMEMLTFYLTDGQLYGLNVFKIIEILETPKRITRAPLSHPNIKGEIDFRGHAITIIDLSEFLGLEPLDYRGKPTYVLVCEYSRTVQGFLVAQPNVLITKSWDEVIKPEGAVYESSYLTAITYHNGQPIQLLDVEKILSEIIGIDVVISPEMLARGQAVVRPEHHILAVDDSRAACKLLETTLDQLGIRHTVVDGAPHALELLKRTLGADGNSPFTVIFTDIEMPVMDGFTFTRQVKEHPQLKNIYLAVHSSMSNKSNQHKAEQMGADDFIPKFTPDNIVASIMRQIERAEERKR